MHLVVPDGVDDPARPSGGNTYDRRVRAGLAARGWTVREHVVAGAWPTPDRAALAGLARAVTAVPDGAVVLVDGLVASAAPDVLVPATARLRVVVLVHLPLGASGSRGTDPGVVDGERRLLAAAAGVLTTSAFARAWLVEHYALPPERVHVATPGVDAADPAPGSPDGVRLLCVAAVVPGKGHDVLVEALAAVADLPWRCDCVGSLERDPAFVRWVARDVRRSGLDHRVTFPGPRTGADLDASYAAADLLVLATRGETYGMVVAEALARGLPVVASEVGGVPEALGSAGGRRPGVLVPAEDPPALAAALRRWLEDPAERRGLRSAAAERRAGLDGWSTTTDRVARVLAGAGS